MHNHGALHTCAVVFHGTLDYLYFFWDTFCPPPHAVAGGRVRSFVWRTLTPRKGNDGITQCDSVYQVCGKTPTRQLHSTPIAVSGSGHTRKHTNSLDAVIRTQESSPRQRLLEGCSYPFMRVVQHLTALRAWCKQCLSVKNQRAPSRHCRDASIYGLSATVMHDTADMSTPPAPRSVPLACLLLIFAVAYVVSNLDSFLRNTLHKTRCRFFHICILSGFSCLERRVRRWRIPRGTALISAQYTSPSYPRSTTSRQAPSRCALL